LFESENEEIKQNFIEFARSIEALIVNSETENTHRKIPMSASRDAGTVLDRFLLSRTSSKRQEPLLGGSDMSHINAHERRIPSFLSARK
jgi:hypothetical protein